MISFSRTHLHLHPLVWHRERLERRDGSTLQRKPVAELLALAWARFVPSCRHAVPLPSSHTRTNLLHTRRHRACFHSEGTMQTRLAVLRLASMHCSVSSLLCSLGKLGAIYSL
jgi:hypothetical protein